MKRQNCTSGTLATAALLLAFCMTAFANQVVPEEESHKVAAPIKYLIFREDCFESFFTRFDFTSDPNCLKFSFSKLVGYLIIGGSVILKLPQIINMLKAGSSKGVAASSYYFETIAMLHVLAMSRHANLPFSVYGETISILI